MDKYHMSEKMAHRYILTSAMDSRIRMSAVAHMILTRKGIKEDASL